MREFFYTAFNCLIHAFSRTEAMDLRVMNPVMAEGSLTPPGVIDNAGNQNSYNGQKFRNI
jgi:hypothetical protein